MPTPEGLCISRRQHRQTAQLQNQQIVWCCCSHGSDESIHAGCPRHQHTLAPLLVPAAGKTKKSLSLLTYIPTCSQIVEGNRPGNRSAARAVCTQMQDRPLELHRQDIEKQEFTRPAGKGQHSGRETGGSKIRSSFWLMPVPPSD